MSPLWRSLDELERDPAFLARIGREFPGLDRLLDGPSRRTALKLMGASLMLSLSACDPAAPKGRIVPAVKAPPGIVPGAENAYASAALLDGYATGVLVRHQAGRPMRIDGNPDHPASLGGIDAISQAQILSLYDPDRAHGVSRRNQPAGWESFRAALEVRRQAIAERHGAGLRILTGTIISPSLAARLAALQKTWPKLVLHQWQAVSRDAVRAGAKLAYGRPVEAIYHLDQADVILSIDSDVLSSAPGHLRYARDFASRRNPVDGPMSRLYAIEPTPGLPGIVADHRFVAGPDDMPAILAGLAAAIMGAPASDAPGWVAPIAADLLAHRGRALIHVGPHQGSGCHALAHVLNEALGGRDTVFRLIEPVEAAPIDQTASLAGLIADMEAGKVEELLVLGENPLFAAPGFAEALERVPFSVSLGQEADETAEKVLWHIPEAHPLESWGDARAYDGTVTLLQPQLQPLYGGHSAAELLALLAGEAPQDGLAMLRDFWRPKLDDAAWHKALATGVVAGSASPAANARIVDAAPRTIEAPADAPPLTLLVRPDPHLWDGRFANNAWLQELPRPLSKLTWDNPLLVAPLLARRLDLKDGDQAAVTAGANRVVMPVRIQPGQAADCVTAFLGFGRRRVGQVGRDHGVDITPLIGAEISIAKVAGTYPLAVTEHHNPLDAAPEGVVREMRLADFASGHRASEPAAEISLYDPPPSSPDTAWAMSIDLNRCIGCNACVTACQSENNVPTVGKAEVLREREMHWLRIDRYYAGDPDAPAVRLQPMLCMHCEEAPCEVVCPVGATMHDAEGLNVMVYNRCIGTRFCSNNCPYKVRRFNYFAFAEDEARPQEARNQEVSVRARGVMEKCTFCVQRIAASRIRADEADRLVAEGEVVTACQAACPTRAIEFGNLKDPASAVSKKRAGPLSYRVLEELNTRPRVTYEARVINANPALKDKA